jgi:undecaprenyl-diphosphatase
MELAPPVNDPAVKTPAHSAPALRSQPSPIPVLDAAPDGPAEHIAEQLDGRRPAVAFAITALAGYLGLLGLTIALGLLLTRVVLTSGDALWRDDEQLSAWFARERTPRLDDASYVGSLIGDIPILPGLVVLAVIILFFAGRRILAAAFIATAGLLELATYRVTSLLVHRDRPLVVKMDAQLPVNQSYPSGHVAASIAVYFALALLISSRTRKTWLRVVVWSLAVLFPLTVALSRLYRGMHHISDVAAGVLVGIGALLVALLAARACDAVIRRRSATATTAKETTT